jgi:hypothetical protein
MGATYGILGSVAYTSFPCWGVNDSKEMQPGSEVINITSFSPKKDKMVREHTKLQEYGDNT